MGKKKLLGLSTIEDVNIKSVPKDKFNALHYMQMLMCQAHYDGSNVKDKFTDCGRHCDKCIFFMENVKEFEEEIRERVSELR